MTVTRTVTSSYSNNHDPVLRDEDVITVTKYDRFRRVPVAEAFEKSRDKIAECDRERGHVLTIKDGTHIKCTECEAEWKDEGF